MGTMTTETYSCTFLESCRNYDVNARTKEVTPRIPRSQCFTVYRYCLLQLETALKLEKGELMADDPTTKSLVQQNIELRRKVEEEHGSYKRKLQAYQDGQQRQAQLVQKLQAKVGCLVTHVTLCYMQSLI